jgi:hypothetical protein
MTASSKITACLEEALEATSAGREDTYVTLRYKFYCRNGKRRLS